MGFQSDCTNNEKKALILGWDLQIIQATSFDSTFDFFHPHRMMILLVSFGSLEKISNQILSTSIICY